MLSYVVEPAITNWLIQCLAHCLFTVETTVGTNDIPPFGCSTQTRTQIQESRNGCLPATSSWAGTGGVSGDPHLEEVRKHTVCSYTTYTTGNNDCTLWALECFSRSSQLEPQSNYTLSYSADNPRTTRVPGRLGLLEGGIVHANGAKRRTQRNPRGGGEACWANVQGAVEEGSKSRSHSLRLLDVDMQTGGPHWAALGRTGLQQLDRLDRCGSPTRFAAPPPTQRRPVFRAGQGTARCTVGLEKCEGARILSLGVPSLSSSLSPPSPSNPSSATRTQPQPWTSICGVVESGFGARELETGWTTLWIPPPPPTPNCGPASSEGVSEATTSDQGPTRPEGRWHQAAGVALWLPGPLWLVSEITISTHPCPKNVPNSLPLPPFLQESREHPRGPHGPRSSPPSPPSTTTTFPRNSDTTTRASSPTSARLRLPFRQQVCKTQFSPAPPLCGRNLVWVRCAQDYAAAPGLLSGPPPLDIFIRPKN